MVVFVHRWGLLKIRSLIFISPMSFSVPSVALAASSKLTLPVDTSQKMHVWEVVYCSVLFVWWPTAWQSANIHSYLAKKKLKYDNQSSSCLVNYQIFAHEKYTCMEQSIPVYLLKTTYIQHWITTNFSTLYCKTGVLVEASDRVGHWIQMSHDNRQTLWRAVFLII